MNKLHVILFTVLAVVQSGAAWSRTDEAAEVLKIADRAYEYQETHPTGTDLWEWQYGTYYSGLFDLYRVNPQIKYLKSMMSMGNRYKWTLRPRPYDANVFAIGHMYLGLYKILGDPRLIENIGYNLDANFERDPRRPDVTMTGNRYWHNWWSWCDALFMAPPTYTLYSEVTGDPKYLEKMDELWQITHAHLYDKAEKLYYRDDKYIGKSTPEGAKVFWSRGNGWVMAGLAKVLQSMPEEYGNREFYTTLFREMAYRIKDLQLSEGYWPTSLLDSSHYGGRESSGTSFFCYALCYGINAGLLPEKEFRQTVLSAWEFLCENVDENGRLGYVQLVGESPENVQESHTESYGQGAFLMAASEVYKLLLR